MIVLDTDVILEPLRADPAAEVIAWLDKQAKSTLYITVTSLTELKIGLAFLPAGKRRDALRRGLDGLITNFFGPRVLAATAEASAHHAEIAATLRGRGMAFSFADAQIAAIAKANRLPIATRDTRPFSAAGLQVINPWQMD